MSEQPPLHPPESPRSESTCVSEDSEDSGSTGSSGSGSSHSNNSNHSSGSSIDKFLDRVRMIRKTTRGNPLHQQGRSTSASGSVTNSNRGEDSPEGSFTGREGSIILSTNSITPRRVARVAIPRDPPEGPCPLTVGLAPSPNNKNSGEQDDPSLPLPPQTSTASSLGFASITVASAAAAVAALTPKKEAERPLHVIATSSRVVHSFSDPNSAVLSRSLSETESGTMEDGSTTLSGTLSGTITSAMSTVTGEIEIEMYEHEEAETLSTRDTLSRTITSATSTATGEIEMDMHEHEDEEEEEGFELHTDIADVLQNSDEDTDVTPTLTNSPLAVAARSLSYNAGGTFTSNASSPLNLEPGRRRGAGDASNGEEKPETFSGSTSVLLSSSYHSTNSNNSSSNIIQVEQQASSEEDSKQQQQQDEGTDASAVLLSTDEEEMVMLYTASSAESLIEEEYHDNDDTIKLLQTDTSNISSGVADEATEARILQGQVAAAVATVAQVQVKNNKVPDHLSEEALESTPTTTTPKTTTETETTTNTTPPRNRVPGGAAAKLMLLGPHDSLEDGSASQLNAAPSEESLLVAEDSLREIEIAMARARQEFEMGSPGNRRYNKGKPAGTGSKIDVRSSQDDDDEEEEKNGDDSVARSATPSFLNRSEIFHKTASAAIAALLQPRMHSMGDGNSSTGGGAAGTIPAGGAISNTHSNIGEAANLQTNTTGLSMSSAFQTPENVGSGSAIAGGISTSVAHQESSYLSYGRRTVSESLLQPKTERKLEALTKRMHDPNKTLTDLLTAIATPESVVSPSDMDLGFMVRRKNACGALKVMTNDARKRMRICWTVGVLPALTSVLSDSAELGLEHSFPDLRIRAEYEAARDRAIVSLLSLATPKENRIPVFHTPDLVQALLAVIVDDKGVARRGCTAILANLAKTIENRLLLAQIPGLLEAAVAVLQPLPPRMEPAPREQSFGDKSPSEEEDSSSETDTTDNYNGKTSKKKKQKEEDDSQDTPIITPSKSPMELVGYDETADLVLRASRQNVFALLAHLGKEKDNAYHFARDSTLVSTLIVISSFQNSPSHTLAVKTLSNLTRHRLNTKLLVFQERSLVPALVKAANSPTDDTRLYACYALQNMAQDRACRQELAMIDGLVTTLCKRGRYAAAEPERLAAISALKNLCDEPANLIPLTNTPECIATLMHLAHGKEEGVTETMRYRACDALATLSHWLRKIATSGKSLDAAQRGILPSPASGGDTNKGGGAAPKLFVPSLRVVTWNQWQ